MPYVVPQFIERETKIAGPFTFKQLIFLLLAGGLGIFLYFSLPLPLFIVVAIILTIITFGLMFLKINGFSLPIIIKNFFAFLVKPRLYLWERKMISPKLIKIDKGSQVSSESATKTQETKIAVYEKSSLKNLSTFLETKTR